MSGGRSTNQAAGPDFGHFRVERRADGTPWTLGVGAMGVTYKAWDEKLRLSVALKVIAAAQVQDAQAQALFVREARAAARVRHTHVASVLALGDTPGHLFYAMEFVEGLSLAERLRQGAPLAPLLALDLALQAARGLGAIHEQKLVHRDLKPANLMLLATAQPPAQEAWRVKIIDFGLARPVSGSAPLERDEGLAATIGFRGTTLYASPEQCEERTDLDGRSDLYSLGCVLWEMLVGAPPFRARTHHELMHLHASASAPLERLAHLPASLQAIAARLLLKDREERFADAEALVRALERARVRIESGEDVGGDSPAATLAQRVAPTSAAPGAQAPRRAWEKVFAVAAVAAVGAATLWFALVKGGRDQGSPAGAPSVIAPDAIPEKSLAVLPFENASDDKADAFFADGIMDDVLTTLAKIKDLKVINRTSVMLYRGAAGAAKLREIGQELGVVHVLEGRVRRSANRVVVTVQLTDVRTARQLWAERYDRTLADSLSLQGELAQEIARELRATLSPAEARSLAAKPTESDEAYTFYLRAREISLQRGVEGKASPAVLELLTKAIALDPNFALAHARLAEAQAYTYHLLRPAEELRRQAFASAKEALRLRPDLGEGHYALGLCYYHGARDYEAALRENASAQQLLPGDAEVISQAAFIWRRQGRWQEAIAGLERARLLDPRNLAIAQALLESYECVHDWAGAAAAARNLANISPPGQAGLILAEVDRIARSDLGSTRAALAAAAGAPDAECELAMERFKLELLAHDFPAAERVLRECPLDIVYYAQMPVPKSLLLAFVAKFQGDPALAQANLEPIRLYMEAEAAKYPNNAARQQALGFVYALLDRKADALGAAKRAMQMLPVAKDAVEGAKTESWACLIYALVGETDQALDLIERSLVTPAGLTLSELRLNPQFDSLRANARFQRILASPEPKILLR